jgi:uncharacterized protein YdbL (DUF1318 family)
MNSQLITRCLFLLFALFAGAAVSRGEDIAAVKARIEARKANVEALKAKKLLGENNRGYLEPRHSIYPADEKTMSDENTDRAALYQVIAGQKGIRMERVGRERAQEIAEEAKRGTWVQDEDGQWYEKQ